MSGSKVNISEWFDGSGDLSVDELCGMLTGFKRAFSSLFRSGVRLMGTRVFLTAIMGVADREDEAGGCALDLVSEFMKHAPVRVTAEVLVECDLLGVCRASKHVAASARCLHVHLKTADCCDLMPYFVDVPFVDRMVEIAGEDIDVCRFLKAMCYCTETCDAMFRHPGLLTALIDAVLRRSDENALGALGNFAYDVQFATTMLGESNFIEALIGALNRDNCGIISDIVDRLCEKDSNNKVVTDDVRIVDALVAYIDNYNVRHDLFRICNSNSSNPSLHSLCSRVCDHQLKLTRALIREFPDKLTEKDESGRTPLDLARRAKLNDVALLTHCTAALFMGYSITHIVGYSSSGKKAASKARYEVMLCLERLAEKEEGGGGEGGEAEEGAEEGAEGEAGGDAAMAIDLTSDSDEPLPDSDGDESDSSSNASSVLSASSSSAASGPGDDSAARFAETAVRADEFGGGDRGSVICKFAFSGSKERGEGGGKEKRVEWGSKSLREGCTHEARRGCL
jgi:hypothetical protein